MHPQLIMTNQSLYFKGKVKDLFKTLTRLESKQTNLKEFLRQWLQ